MAPMKGICIRGTMVAVPFQTDLSLIGTLPGRPRRGTVVQAILHHDACLSARKCHAALLAQGYSTHFCIDNDGTVFQFSDPATRVTWHAKGQVRGADGGALPAGFNMRSIGIDISNAVLPRYSGRYTPPRELRTLQVQGHPIDGLMPYQVQVDATLALLRVLRQHFPELTAAHRNDLRWYGDIQPTTPGIYGHAQVSARKIDPFGFPFNRLVEV